MTVQFDKFFEISEYVCGEKVATAVNGLAEEGKRDGNPITALNTVMERYATFEKNVGQMLVNNEIEISTFLLSDTPMSKLLNKDIPAITAAKSELEQLTRLVNFQIIKNRTKRHYQNKEIIH